MHPATTFGILEGLHLILKKKFSTCCLLPFEPPLPERTMGKPSGFPTFSFGNMVWKIVSFLSLRYWNTYCFNSHKTNEGSPFLASDIYFSHMLYQPYNTVSLSYKLICVLQGIRSETLLTSIDWKSTIFSISRDLCHIEDGYTCVPDLNFPIVLRQF